jgi:hypothetical protein
MYTHTHTYTYVHTYTHTHTRAHAYPRFSVSMFVKMGIFKRGLRKMYGTLKEVLLEQFELDVRVCVFIYICMSVCGKKFELDVHVCVYIYIDIFVCVCMAR